MKIKFRGRLSHIPDFILTHIYCLRIEPELPCSRLQVLHYPRLFVRWLSAEGIGTGNCQAYFNRH